MKNPRCAGIRDEFGKGGRGQKIKNPLKRGGGLTFMADLKGFVQEDDNTVLLYKDL